MPYIETMVEANLAIGEAFGEVLVDGDKYRASKETIQKIEEVVKEDIREDIRRRGPGKE